MAKDKIEKEECKQLYHSKYEYYGNYSLWVVLASWHPQHIGYQIVSYLEEWPGKLCCQEPLYYCRY